MFHFIHVERLTTHAARRLMDTELLFFIAGVGSDRHLATNGDIGHMTGHHSHTTNNIPAAAQSAQVLLLRAVIVALLLYV